MRTSAEITAAANECLERCRTCGLPAVELPAFLAALKLERGWDDADIQVVKTAVVRIIGEENVKRRR